MKLHSAQDVIAVARARGFDVRVNPGPPPMPVLVCPAKADKNLVSPALMAALTAWRLEIIEELTAAEAIR
jgi:hypothetical protein